MKLNENFVLRQVAGSWMVLPLKNDTLDFDGMIRLNNSGAILWRCLEQGGDRDALVRALTEKYDVSIQQAAADVDEFLGILKQVGCIQS